ncbi:MAG: SRPBCC family protein [Acidimicrobiales bacterium]
MPLHASKAVVVDASPQETLELLLDLEAYRKIDPKIRKVKQAPELDDDGRRIAKIVGSMWHFPPAPDTHLVHLKRWRQLTFIGKPKVFARTIYAFAGQFDTVEVDEGTQLTHKYDITFRQPPAAFFDSTVQRWLDADLDEEMERVAARLGEPS